MLKIKKLYWFRNNTHFYLFYRVKTYLPARDDAAEFDDHDRDFPSGIGNNALKL